MAQAQRDPDFFLGPMWLWLADYEPDLGHLLSPPITVAVGEASEGRPSEGRLAHRAGVAFAERLGKDLALFPGDHGGFLGHPGAFAERLDEILTAGCV
jgi:hypothetical protein